MSIPVLTFFNNKGGVGKTSLVYHLAWMLSDLGHRVLACDLDPQANLTAVFLDESRLENLWNEGDVSPKSGITIFECVKPLMQVADLKPPRLQPIIAQPSLFGGDTGPNDLKLIPGDLALAEFEDTLSAEWPIALGSSNLYRPFRILTAFSTIMQAGASTMTASIILADVGPNLGAINRSALIAIDYVVVPLGADLFSLRGLRNLGPTLNRWRRDWRSRRGNWSSPEFALPNGDMKPAGYIMQQHGIRLNRPVIAYDKWVNRMPAEYARNLLGDNEGPYAETPADDELHALATVKHYRSLVPMAQKARKPIFHLTPADGAIGSHAAAASDAYKDFKVLAEKITARINVPRTSL
ncbi:MAG: AAA family ATPase [Candidatus Poribacteria bacterium]|nr:AAA family ATPase [Candidatus Poribacteria bacterium]MDE0503613.1 AAA family ATPase [Candidatus Poribacteria bacterium]